MEIRTIAAKCFVLAYIPIASRILESAHSSWFLLSALLYMSMTLLLYLVKPRILKTAVLVLTLFLAAVASVFVHPLFVLLLPVHIYELVWSYTSRNGLAMLPAAIPLLFLPSDLTLSYTFVALLTFAFCTMLRRDMGRFKAYMQEAESMRSRIDNLSKRLDESNAYIKQSEYTFKLEERNRMSQEIHDKIGHSMTGALIQMEASKLLLQSDPGKSAELLQNAIHISKEGIESIRQVLKNVKPATEQLGINRLRLLLDDFSAKRTIRTTLIHEGNIDVITPLQWKTVLENVQEALTNAMKYSNATAVTVRIQVLSTLVRVEIADNGKGAAKVIKGMGIRGMEERTASLNGKVIVDGSQGFSVTMLLPYGS